MATIQELESFKLSDAVSFHKELNPKLWEDEKLDPEVRDQLMLIAEDFVEYLGISNLKVKDVTISGSNAAYSYTPHSDLDLHVLVDFNELPNNEVYQELFTAKKTLYNEAHNITVRDVPVELYVQDTSNPVQSLGEYSIVHDKWIRIPKKRRANFDEVATKAKYEKLGDLIELAIKSKDPKRVNDTIALVKRYRKSGLDKAGEFGPENLAYKAVRKQGLVQALHDLKAELHGEKLSIEEDADKQAATLKIQKHLNKKYGANLDLDGKLGPLTLKSINKFMPRAKTGLADEPNKTTAVQGKKLKEAPRTLQSQVTPLEKLVQDYGYLTTFGMSHLDKQGATPEAQQQLLALVQRMSKDGKTFANLDKQKMESNRDTILNHIHSMMQYAIPVLKKNLPADKWEAKRSQINGVLTAYNDARQINEASGYIPSEKEKNDPRFKTALTVDVKPDAIKKNAKAFGFKTSRAGIPPQARADGKIAEDLMREFKTFLGEQQEEISSPTGYHVSKTSNRDSIRSTGLTPKNQEDLNIHRNPGVYFFKSLDDAKEWAHWGKLTYKEPYDIWRIRLSDTHKISKDSHPEMQEFSSYVTHQSVPPKNIDLASSNDLQKLGFDGAIINESIPNDSNAKSGQVWVAFSPNQVKSVYNRGSFSPDDSRLTKETAQADGK